MSKWPFPVTPAGRPGEGRKCRVRLGLRGVKRESVGEGKDRVGVKGCGCGLLSGRGLRCPRRTRASGLEARMGDGRRETAPGRGGGAREAQGSQAGTGVVDTYIIRDSW